MLGLKVGDRVRCREGGVTGRVMSREIWPNEDPDLDEGLELLPT